MWIFINHNSIKVEDSNKTREQKNPALDTFS